MSVRNALCAPITACMKLSNVMATKAGKPNAEELNCARLGNIAGNIPTGGGMLKAAVGTVIAIGMITTTTAAIATEITTATMTETSGSL